MRQRANNPVDPVVMAFYQLEMAKNGGDEQAAFAATTAFAEKRLVESQQVDTDMVAHYQAVLKRTGGDEAVAKAEAAAFCEERRKQLQHSAPMLPEKHQVMMAHPDAVLVES